MTEDRKLANGDANTVIEYFAAIHIYRHLISNLRSKGDVAKSSSIQGARAAAVLARLWASDDLGQEPELQKKLGFDLDLGQSDLGKSMGRFLKDGLVEQVPARSQREKCYRITAKGKQELKAWMEQRYAPREYLKLLLQMNPDVDKMEKLLLALKQNVREMLT